VFDDCTGLSHNRTAQGTGAVLNALRSVTLATTTERRALQAIRTQE
jgi:hypothetical protein